MIERRGNINLLADSIRRYSSYIYGADNPIRFIDPDGRAAVPLGKTYDAETEELIYNDGIDDKKVHIRTKTEGADRKYTGQESNFKDVTTKFNTQLSKTEILFSQKSVGFPAAESRILAG